MSIFYSDILLFIKMVVASMIWWYNSSLLDLLKEVNKSGPLNGASWGVPILDFMYRVNWDEFLRLM